MQFSMVMAEPFGVSAIFGWARSVDRCPSRRGATVDRTPPQHRSDSAGYQGALWRSQADTVGELGSGKSNGALEGRGTALMVFRSASILPKEAYEELSAP